MFSSFRTFFTFVEKILRKSFFAIPLLNRLSPFNFFKGIITCGPPLWDIIASQNFHSIKQALQSLGDQRVPFRLPHRVSSLDFALFSIQAFQYSVSDLLGEPLLSRIPQANYD